MALWSDKMILACLERGGIIELHSPFKPREIAEILAGQILPFPTFFEYSYSPLSSALHRSCICGSIDRDHFELHAGPRPRASLVALGTITPTEAGSTIEIEIKQPEGGEVLLYRHEAAIMNRYKYDLEVILDWLKSWIGTDDVTEFPTIE
jgi:hypothetical protein